MDEINDSGKPTLSSHNDSYSNMDDYASAITRLDYYSIIVKIEI